VSANWNPALDRVAGRDGLTVIWAMALTVALGRRVRPAEVAAALQATDHWDAGLEPAVTRWKAVPPSLRFCPPGIRRSAVTEADVRMWLKVGAILERAL